MAKITILSIDKKTGAVKATVTDFTNDKDAAASIKKAGLYAFVEAHELEPVKSATKGKDNE